MHDFLYYGFSCGIGLPNKYPHIKIAEATGTWFFWSEMANRGATTLALRGSTDIDSNSMLGASPAHMSLQILYKGHP